LLQEEKTFGKLKMSFCLFFVFNFMEIIWHGQSFFEIRTKDSAKEEIKIVIDPFDEKLGLKVPKSEAHLLLITHHHEDHANVGAVGGQPFLIDGPGEYGVKGVFVKGVLSFHDNVSGKERGLNTIYKIEAEGIKICHTGDLGQKELTESQLEEIGEVDLLMIPVGGVYTIEAKAAAEIVSQIEPRLVIPMHYKLPKLKIGLEEVSKFLKVMGVEGITPEKKLRINLKDLPREETKIVVLEAA